eukprot:CAMPEP_0201576738 /NCGR_PEP_ID=MMETSP0190_2-20130828/22726_1 /ASSEMBLY_ACC=CAM_ASM_000263 /TAXON_ID=37353 /ORGANISM="Rosalina sp." /LENGTH=431 /DNA_ID=CAMNT_0048007973 /DNA_START=60 /DNA_END=1355 /DNA_ORIENTATION=+
MNMQQGGMNNMMMNNQFNPNNPGGPNMNMNQGGMNMNPMMQNMQNNQFNPNNMPPMGMGNMPPAPGMPGGPPLSGPNPFMMNPQGGPMMGGNPMMNMNPMMNPQGGPQITVNMMNPQGLPPSPPPPNNLPLPPNPSNFKLPNLNQNQQLQGNTQGNDDQNRNNNEQNGNNQNGDTQGQNNGPKPNQFQLPFNGLPPNFPAPTQAPQLNMANNGPSAPNTPNKIGQPGPMTMPSFLPPLGGNPMFNGLGALPPQLSPQLNPNMAPTNTGGSNSPQMNASPPNLFVPPYGPMTNPPPPGNMAGIKPPFMPTGPNGIPSPNLAQLPGGIPGLPNQQRRGPNSPSPPVSPILNQPLPFIPSPQLLQHGNPNMPPMALGGLGGNPMLKNNPGLNAQFAQMKLGGNQGIHMPMNMQKPNPMLNQGPPQNQNNQGGNR